jgi:hypothetical protein
VRTIIALGVIGLAATVTPDAHAYCLQPNLPGGTMSWAQTSVPFRIHDTGSSAGAKAAELAAVRAAFAEWAAAPCAGISFPEGALLPASDAVTHYPTERGIRVYWARNATEWGGSDTTPIAKTFYSFDSNGALLAGVSVLNAMGTYQWSTTGEAGKFDVQGIMAFQIGRLIGVAQSNVTTAVMYAPFMAGDVTRRQLTADDAAAVAYLYPKPGADPGTCPLTTPDASCPGTPPPRPGTLPDDGGVSPPADGGGVTPADGGGSPPAADGSTGGGGGGGGGGGSTADGGFHCTANAQCESGICTVDGVCLPRSGDGGGCRIADAGQAPACAALAVGLALAVGWGRRRRPRG